ncbi:TonB-dependent receptor plug domain-containing protein [Acanthopleuribacter pedis]|uniref:TonB-dependent receptor n=1 Tax=Acanthopleuribacter pedis TaxID=442870 RepID=A0A8J7U145_9BACT|nr:TonB-dependent receptor [Acanthopleuribacter pedis]MBO1317778.1 TonB-dependent receptor [Acanthopleuribacter pedis]
MNPSSRLFFARFTALLFFACALPFAHTQSMNLEDELKFLQAESFVITASRTLENLRKSAASVTVISEQQIRDMGARNLAEVLRSVPGMNISVNSLGFYEIEARGIKSVSSEKIMFMIDNHVVNNILLGTAMLLHDDAPLDHVQRIEIVRGPGSALYGANAFLAIVNIITHDGDNLDFVEANFSQGHHDTAQANLRFGKRWGALTLALNANYLTSDGINPHIEVDAPRFLDQLLGTQSSLAPGPADWWNRKHDAHLKLGYRDWELTAHYTRKRTGPFLGFENIVNRGGRILNNGHFIDLKRTWQLADDWSLKSRMYQDNTVYRPSFDLFLEGMPIQLPTGGFAFIPETYSGTINAKNNRLGTDLEVTYKALPRHEILFGLTAEHQRQYEVRYNANFNPLNLAPLGAEVDLTDTLNWNRNISREFWALFVEDIWDVTDQWRITLGARYDRYSDFGGNFNPRLGVVWVKNRFNLKLLYGEAFRAPNFSEQHNTNNPSILSNPDVKPEAARTHEMSVGFEPNVRTETRLTLFYTDIDDLIVQVPLPDSVVQVVVNAPGLVASGLEWELRTRWGKGSYFGINYNYQDTEIDETDTGLPETPNQKGHLMLNHRFNETLNLFGEWIWRGEARRGLSDPRDRYPGYDQVNTTLSINEPFGVQGFSAQLSCYNLLDEAITYPSPEATVPFDYPNEERNLRLKLIYRY